MVIHGLRRRSSAAQTNINSAAALYATVFLALMPPLLVGGCKTYRPAPRSLSDTARGFSARTFSLEAAAQVCRRLAPAAPCDPVKPDRLLLFVALLDNNPDIATARAHLASVEAAARAARTPPGATLTLSTEYAGAAPEPSPWLFGFGLEIPLDTGGRRSAQITAADLGVISARYDLAETIWAARMALVRALDDTEIAAQQLAAANELAQIQERRLQAEQRRVSAGEASRIELERIRSDLADARHREAATTGAQLAGQARIAKALGMTAAALPPTAFVSAGSDVAFAPPLPSAQVRAQALLARADLLKAMVAYDQAEIELRGELAKQYPAISVGPGFTWERGLVKLPFNVGLVLPPLDLNRTNIRTADARRSEAGLALEAAFATASGSIDAANAEVSASRRNLEQIRALDLPVARRLAVQADREIASGAIDRTEWAAAQAGQQIARLTELDALSHVMAANAALEDALRRPLSGPETLIQGVSQ